MKLPQSSPSVLKHCWYKFATSSVKEKSWKSLDTKLGLLAGEQNILFELLGEALGCTSTVRSDSNGSTEVGIPLLLFWMLYSNNTNFHNKLLNPSKTIFFPELAWTAVLPTNGELWDIMTHFDSLTAAMFEEEIGKLGHRYNKYLSFGNKYIFYIQLSVDCWRHPHTSPGVWLQVIYHRRCESNR